MRAAGTRHFEKLSTEILVLFLLAGMIPATPLRSQEARSHASLDRTRSMAETQHEIVMLLLKKKEYEKAAVEANKIFEMKWPEDQEPLLLREMIILSDLFMSEGRPELSLQLIDRHEKCFKMSSSRAALWKERGYIFKKMKDDDKAIDCFRKARELEDETD